MFPRSFVVTVAAALGLAVICGCTSKPKAEVSSKELAKARAHFSSVKPGAPQSEVLGAAKAGNAVKLGASTIDGAVIEEWKYEAFHDERHRKDLFVTFLYFCNDRFVDASDTRIDFRNNPELVARWIGRPAD
jgi:hypothetical protein